MSVSNLIKDLTVLGIGAEVGADKVVYQATGVGSVPMTIENKLQETISVKDFGAVGDGVADDTAALQAAIDHVQSLQFGGGILIPVGKYKITASLVVGNKRIGIGGAGCGSVLIPHGLAGAAVIKIQGGVDSNLSVMQDFQIVAPTSGTAMGIDAIGATAWTFREILINGMTVGMQFDDSFAVCMKDMYVGNCSDSAFRFNGMAHNCSLRDTAIYNCGVGAAKPMVDFTEFGTENFLIDGCDFEVGYQAIGLKANTAFTLSNTYIEQISNSIFKMNGTPSYAVRVIGNYIGIAGGYVIEQINGGVIEGNHFYDMPVSVGAAASNMRYGVNYKNGTGNELINRLAIADASDTGNPSLAALGFAPNIQINYRSKGNSGHVFTTNGGASVHLEVSGQNTDATHRAIVSGTSSASKRVEITAFSNVDADSSLLFRASGAGLVRSGSPFRFDTTVGFNGANPIVKPTVSGSRAGNAALQSLIAALSSYGLVTDSTTA